MVEVKRFPMNWWYVGFCLVIATAIFGFMCWDITAQFYKAHQQGLPASGGWTWPMVAIVDVAFLWCLAALFWKAYCDWQTEFTAHAVVRPGLFGRRVIRWADVTEVKVFNEVGYHIRSGRKRISITPPAYKDPWDVVVEIEERFSLSRVQ